MAFALKLSSIDTETFAKITQVCVVTPKPTPYCEAPIPVQCLAVNPEEDRVYLPLGVWKKFLDDPPVRRGKESRGWPKTQVKCHRIPFSPETDPKGYRDQNIVVEEAWAILREERVVFLALATGFGKTTLGNYFCGKTRLKTLVMCHIDKVNKQWVEEFSKFSTAKVQFLKGVASAPGKKGKKFDPTADVYVGGIEKVAGMDRSYLSQIGLVILDEAHVSTITAFSRALLRVRPKYVIGLSATPKRSDGMEKILAMYFGHPSKFILRRETKDFTVRKVVTGFKPKLKYQIYKGRATPNWCTLTNSIAAHTPIHDFVINKLTGDGEHAGPEWCAMIMSERVDECQAIYDRLSALLPKGSVELSIGGISKTDEARIDLQKYRILVASCKRCGTGYNDSRLNLCFLLSDHKSTEQYEGRLRTVDCIIYDFVSDYRALENHWKLREKWYTGKGGKIEIIDIKGNPVSATIAAAPTNVRRGPKNTAKLEDVRDDTRL